MIKDQLPELSAHANDSPRDKLPVDAQRTRTWPYAQVKMHISNDNPFEADELGILRAQRTRAAHSSNVRSRVSGRLLAELRIVAAHRIAHPEHFDVAETPVDTALH